MLKPLLTWTSCSNSRRSTNIAIVPSQLWEWLSWLLGCRNHTVQTRWTRYKHLVFVTFVDEKWSNSINVHSTSLWFPRHAGCRCRIERSCVILWRSCPFNEFSWQVSISTAPIHSKHLGLWGCKNLLSPASFLHLHTISTWPTQCSWAVHPSQVGQLVFAKIFL